MIKAEHLHLSPPPCCFEIQQEGIRASDGEEAGCGTKGGQQQRMKWTGCKYSMEALCPAIGRATYAGSHAPLTLHQLIHVHLPLARSRYRSPSWSFLPPSCMCLQAAQVASLPLGGKSQQTR